jgi:1-pyrroline-5-carboxylate dehydrogenase
MLSRSSKFVKNLSPKYRFDQGYTNEIINIIHETIKSPRIIPIVIGGQDKTSNIINKQMSTLDKSKIICEYTQTSSKLFDEYKTNFQEYKKSLSSLSHKDINNIFIKAADLIKTKYREQIIAYTILGQGKSLYEADIDAACELTDFWNFNANFANEIISKQPISTKGIKNTSKYNPLNGFVAAITPFNFTAIGGNLASAPVLFKNSVIWKPSDSAILSNYLVYEILVEAGMPKESIAFTPCDPEIFSKEILSSPDLGGVLFTGSTTVFDNMLSNIYSNIVNYNSYPRVIGETGGKNWHFLHKDLSYSDLWIVAEKTIESAFGYSGQKCSACSIVYIPDIHYSKFIDILKSKIDDFMEMDSFQNYGLINNASYSRINRLIETFKTEEKYTILKGGRMDYINNYFCEPTVVTCPHHSDQIFNTEFFAPILAVYKYSEKDLDKTMRLCRDSNNYALTGSVFSNNKKFIQDSTEFFKEKCGNFYINDKSTGSVVGQQPFGGSGCSGTNDKAGDINLLYRLFNQQTIKRNKNF